MSVRIERHQAKGFTMLPNALLRDSRLSPRAKAVLVTLLSHEDGWIHSAHAVLRAELRIGKDAITGALNELRDAGYVTDSRERDALGHIRSVVVLRDSGIPGDGNLGSREDRETLTGGAEVEALDVEPLDEEPREALELAPPSAAETPNQLANRITTGYVERQPMSRFPAVAGIVRTALKAGHSEREIVAALNRLVEEGRSVTVETLRIEIEGLPAQRRRGVAALDQIAEQLREAERA